jgi:hypothetical protein
LDEFIDLLIEREVVGVDGVKHRLADVDEHVLAGTGGLR